MHTSLLKLPEVVRRTGRSKSTIYDEVNRGLFPRPIKIGRRTYWRDDEIARVVDAYTAGSSLAELQGLCVAIVACRAQARS